jgi:hypothetical protein
VTSEQSSTISNFGLTHVIVPPNRVQTVDFTGPFEQPNRGSEAIDVQVTAQDARAIGADLVAAAGPLAVQLGAPERAVAQADPLAMVYTADAPLAVVALEPDAEGMRTAAARAVRASRTGGTVAWALDATIPLSAEEHVRALAEGAVLGGYDGRRWRSGERPPGVEGFVELAARLGD